MKRVLVPGMVLLVLLLGFTNNPISRTPSARADGFIDFESGVDGQPIQSSIPGLQFTTTMGYDWIYGDWRTGRYNGPYPAGSYYSNGNFFAWLGPNQGSGRIDFTEGCATYLQAYVSSAYGLYADAYYMDGTLAATAYVDPNLNTGQMARLRVDAPPGDCFHYVILHDTGNFWLIDDLSTDASGVPATRPPVVILPGLTGSVLNVTDTCKDETFEVWPAPEKMLVPYNTDEHLDHLMLDEHGEDPFSVCDNVFVNRATNNYIENGAIRILGPDLDIGPLPFRFYADLIDALKVKGFTVYTYGYDWRLDLQRIIDKPGDNNDLDDFIDRILAENNATKVNLVGHSLGGLLARQYITSGPEYAGKVEQVISIGTPYLGAPKSLKTLRWGDTGAPGWLWGAIGLYAPKVRELSQNSPSFYQILPSFNYFEVYGSGYYSKNGTLKDYSQTRYLIYNEHNDELMMEAEDFHDDAMDDWGRVETGVTYNMIVGSGRMDTPGKLNEYTILDWGGSELITWDMENINGDGTVPLHSADMQGNGHTFRGDARVWYTNGLDHMEIGQKGYILDFIAALLATPPTQVKSSQTIDMSPPKNSTAPGLYSGPRERFPQAAQQITAPPIPPEMDDVPFEVNGGQIVVNGDVDLHIYDEFGNHTGATEYDRIEYGIPGSSYEKNGEVALATVPFGSNYTIQMFSNGEEEVHLTFKYLLGEDLNLTKRKIIYSNVPIGKNGSAELIYAPDMYTPANEIAIDQDQDGTLDFSIPPSGDLDGEQINDHTAPEIVVQLEGQKSPQGWYIGQVEVTIVASDEGSGVFSIDYSDDMGEEVHDYTTPFLVNAGKVRSVVMRVIDVAGNQSWKEVNIGPAKIFVPLLNKGK